MYAHRIETILTENGKLTLQNLPFQQGDEVEIIIFERRSYNPESNSHSLRGKVISYEDPFEPAVPVEDWDVLQ
ncbi:MAG: hypothetical protein ACRC2R_24385 [Xenococcaceae cyanobacterium]